MPERKPIRKFGTVTLDGRVVVDVDSLYRSKHVQRSLKELDGRIIVEKNRRAVPDSAMRSNGVIGNYSGADWARVRETSSLIDNGPGVPKSILETNERHADK